MQLEYDNIFFDIKKLENLLQDSSSAFPHITKNNIYILLEKCF